MGGNAEERQAWDGPCINFNICGDYRAQRATAYVWKVNHRLTIYAKNCDHQSSKSCSKIPVSFSTSLLHSLFGVSRRLIHLTMMSRGRFCLLSSSSLELKYFPRWLLSTKVSQPWCSCGKANAAAIENELNQSWSITWASWAGWFFAAKKLPSWQR